MSSPQIQEIQIVDVNQPNDLSQPLLEERVHRGRKWCICKCNCLSNDPIARRGVKALGIFALTAICAGVYLIGHDIASDNCDSMEGGIKYYQECWPDSQFRTGAYLELVGGPSAALNMLWYFATIFRGCPGE